MRGENFQPGYAPEVSPVEEPSTSAEGSLLDINEPISSPNLSRPIVESPVPLTNPEPVTVDVAATDAPTTSTLEIDLMEVPKDSAEIEQLEDHISQMMEKMGQG